MRPLPRFPVTTVGSWPRPKALLRALRRKRRREISEAEFGEIADAAVLESLRAQEASLITRTGQMGAKIAVTNGTIGLVAQ